MAVTNRVIVDGGFKTANGIAQCSTEGIGHCNIAFSKWQPWGNYEVLETDYKTYSVVWSCSSFYAFRWEWAWIIARDPFFDSDKVLDIVTRQTSLVLEDFVKDNQTNCPDEDVPFAKVDI